MRAGTRLLRKKPASSSASPSNDSQTADAGAKRFMLNGRNRLAEGVGAVNVSVDVAGFVPGITILGETEQLAWGGPPCTEQETEMLLETLPFA